MISKFCPAGQLILIFIRRVSLAAIIISAFQGVSHFSNKYSSTVYTKSELDSVGQKNFRGESTMDGDMYLRPDKCIFGFLNSD